MRLDGRLLLAFYVLAQELHFARAAARLHMTQPPFSQSIKKLEEIVGVSLFERSTRSVRLTPAGLRMYEHAAKICVDMEDMLLAVRQLARDQAESLSIGITASAAQTPLVQALRDYKSTRPYLRLELHDLDSVEIVPALRQQELDLALMRPYITDADIDMHVVYREHVGLVLPQGDLLAGRQISLQRVADHPLIGYRENRSPYFRQLIDKLFSDHHLHANIVQESRLPEILTLVEVGIAYAIVPWSMAKTRLESLHYTPIPEAYKYPAEIAVATLQKNDKPQVADIIHFLLNHPDLQQ